jgi:PleD family two-component response regulator
MILEPTADKAAELRARLLKGGVQTVEWATRGVGWIAAWQNAKPDLTLVSLALPERDGFYCLRKIRELIPDHPVLFIHDYSGFLASEIEWKALAGGAQGVLQRPCAESRFLASVARMVEQIQRQKRLKSIRVNPNAKQLDAIKSALRKN